MFHADKETGVQRENLNEAKKEVFAGNFILVHYDRYKTVSVNKKTKDFLADNAINGLDEHSTAQRYLEEMFSHKMSEFLPELPKSGKPRQTPLQELNEKVSKVGTVANLVIVMKARSKLLGNRIVYVKYGYRNNDKMMVVDMHIDDAFDYEMLKIKYGKK